MDTSALANRADQEDLQNRPGSEKPLPILYTLQYLIYVTSVLEVLS